VDVQCNYEEKGKSKVGKRIALAKSGARPPTISQKARPPHHNKIRHFNVMNHYS
jgi:hypothetical protein